MPTARCRCKVCLRDTGKSRYYPNRAAVVKHRRLKHPNEPLVRNWSKSLPMKKKEKGARRVKRFCTWCGKATHPEWRFCRDCGTKL